MLDDVFAALGVDIEKFSARLEKEIKLAEAAEDLFSKFIRKLSEGDIIEAEKLILKIRNDPSPRGYDKPFFEEYLKSIGVSEAVSLTEALKRPDYDKLYHFIKTTDINIVIDKIGICDLLQIKDNQDKLFNKVTNALKREGFKIAFRDYRSWCIITKKPG